MRETSTPSTDSTAIRAAIDPGDEPRRVGWAMPAGRLEVVGCMTDQPERPHGGVMAPHKQRIVASRRRRRRLAQRAAAKEADRAGRLAYHAEGARLAQALAAAERAEGRAR